MLILGHYICICDHKTQIMLLMVKIIIMNKYHKQILNFSTKLLKKKFYLKFVTLTARSIYSKNLSLCINDRYVSKMFEMRKY